MQKNSKIPLYKERTFGEKFSVTFAFLRQNWKLWLQLSCYLLLPLCLVQALALNAMAGGIIEGGMLSESVGDIMPSELQDGAGYLVSYLALILFNYVGVSILVAMLYSMMRYDRDHAGGLSGVAFADLKQMFFKGLRRALLLLFALSLLTILYFVIILLLVSLSLWFLLLGVVLLFALAIAMTHSLPVYLFEDDMTMFGAIGRGFILGWLTWGGTFLLLLVVGILAGFVQGFTTMPWYIAMIVKMVFAINDDGSAFTSSLTYSSIMYVLAVVQAFGAYLTTSFSVVALAYQYGSAAEQRDHFSVDEDIQRFEKMADNNDEIENFESL